MSTEFYRCPVCGNVIIKLVDSGVTPHCCGEEMELLDANTYDGPKEKHVPVIFPESDYAVKVKIGAVPHPMTDPHFIQAIYLETKQHNHDVAMIAWLNPDDEAEHVFNVKPSEVKAVYEYCNLHGLWKCDCTTSPCRGTMYHDIVCPEKKPEECCEETTKQCSKERINVDVNENRDDCSATCSK